MAVRDCHRTEFGPFWRQQRLATRSLNHFQRCFFKDTKVTQKLLLAINATEAVALLERLFGFRIMNPEVFVISRIPSELRWTNVGLVAGVALILTTIATLYPAWRASRVAPAEALRYE